MMLNIFKKPKVVFECVVPGVERLMPMIPASELKHAWVRKAQLELAEVRKQPEWNMHKLNHTARCPGIFSLQRHGWIMRTWQDITIETYGDKRSFNWRTPIDQTRLNPAAGEYVEAHPETQLANYMDNWREDTLRTIIKIQSPWRCIVPKGYYLLEMPVPYADENRFTAVQGYFSREQGPAQLNPQLLWHMPEGKTLIKAGTPIAHYLLVPKDKFSMEIKADKKATDQDFLYLVNNFRFVKNYGETKKFFGGDK